MSKDHRILVVDGEPNIRDGIAMLLSAQGYSASTAEHGFDALLQLRSLRSFPLSILREDLQEIQETPCLFCRTPVRYIIDFSLSVASPNTHVAEMADAVQPVFSRSLAATG